MGRRWSMKWRSFETGRCLWKGLRADEMDSLEGRSRGSIEAERGPALDWSRCDEAQRKDGWKRLAVEREVPGCLLSLTSGKAKQASVTLANRSGVVAAPRLRLRGQGHGLRLP